MKRTVLCGRGVPAAFVLLLFAFTLALPAHARLLPETLLLPQCEFYPLREQDRGLLYRYTDLPLFVDPDLPEDPPDPRFETRRHRYWGEWFSQADWNAAEALGKDFGFDGHAFFPRPHRVRYWDAMEKSPVRDFCEVPIAPDYADSADDLAKWFSFAVRSPRAYRLNGKALILSYRFGAKNPPNVLKAKLDRMRREVGDAFLFVCDLSELYNPDRATESGRLPAETVVAYREKIRAYLRVADGVILGDAFSCMTFEGKVRVFSSSLYAQLAAILRETTEEPEFRGRKLFALGAVLQHENPSVQFWTANEDGLRTLTESLRIACAAAPDVILLPEWDELNENTCVGPTLANGFSVKRVISHFRAVLGRQPLAPLAGDDVSKPNLIVSYRRLVSPGERFLVDILNVPDGARKGPLAVSVQLLDPDGKSLAQTTAKEFSEETLVHVRFPLPSAVLSERARTVRVRLRYKTASSETVVVEDGLSPVSFLPASSFCLKETHQPIRDLAPMASATSVAFEGGRLTARLVCDEPIRHAYLVGNGAVQRVFGDPADPRASFVDDASNLVFAVSGLRPEMLDKERFAYGVRGASSVDWLDWRGIRKGARFNTDWLSTIGDPYYFRIPRQDVETAELGIGFGAAYRGKIDLGAVVKNGFYAVSASNGVQFAVTRFSRQPRFPSVGKSREMTFTCVPEADRPSMAYHVTLVTASGKTWRSRPFVAEVPSETVKTRVWDDVGGTLRLVKLPRARVPVVTYDFSAEAGDGVPTSDGFRRFATVAGGQYSCVTLWNRSSSGSMDYPIGFRRTNLAAGSAAPTHVRAEGAPGELVFDGVNDSIAFPWEVVPQNAAYRVAFEIFPESIEGSVALFGSKSLLNVTLEEGELVVSAAGVANARTGLRLASGRWQSVELRHLGDAFAVTVDGQLFRTAARLPATFMSSLVFGQPKGGTKMRFFKGRLRRLSFNPVF